MAGTPSKKGARDMVLRLRANVILDEVKVTSVQIEEKVPVCSEQGPAIQGTAHPAAGVGEGLLDVVERLKHIEDPRVLVEELPSEGGATARCGKQQDVLPRRLNRHPAVIAQSCPSGVLRRDNKKANAFSASLFHSHHFLTKGLSRLNN